MIKKKICLIGAFAVGKTSLVQQYLHSIFSEKYHTTVGVKIDKKSIDVEDRSVDLIIWDLHGEDDFQSVRMSYLRGASGCLYVVDRTRKATLDVALELQARVEQAIGPVPSILIINKDDLDAQWEIDDRTMESLRHQTYHIIRTSAKTGHGVESAFFELAARMLREPLQ
jgi:small GTP-binding protein